MIEKMIRQRLAEVGQQVPAIRDLLSLRGALSSRLRIRACTVTANDLHSRVGFEPFRNRIGFSIREQIHHPMGFHVHQNGSVAMSPTDGPIVDA